MWYAVAVVLFVNGQLVSEAQISTSKAACEMANAELVDTLNKSDRVREYFVQECKPFRLGVKG